MKIKKLSVGIAGIFLLVAAGSPQTALADLAIKMDLRFAGTFVTGIVHVADPVTGATAPSALIHTTAVGSLGPAETRGFGGKSHVAGVLPECLGIPFGLHIVIDENPLVFAFKDLSLLFAKGGSGDICIDFVTGVNKFVIEIDFDGGRGRFEGATGHATITGEAEPVNADRTFLAETGTIVGTIIVP